MNKAELLKTLKAQAYDQIALKEQAESNLKAINAQIVQVANMPDDAPLDPPPAPPADGNENSNDNGDDPVDGDKNPNNTTEPEE